MKQKELAIAERIGTHYEISQMMYCRMDAEQFERLSEPVTLPFQSEIGLLGRQFTSLKTVNAIAFNASDYLIPYDTAQDIILGE